VSRRAVQEKRERRCDKRERSLTHGALRPDRAADGWRIRAATAYCRRQQLKRDLRALVPISQRRALRLHLESIRIPDGIRRIRKADNRHALVVGGDVAESANAFESELVGRVGLGGHGDLRAGRPIAQPSHHDVAANQRRIDVGHVATGTFGGVFANEENLLLVRILQALGNGLRQRSRAHRYEGSPADTGDATNHQSPVSYDSLHRRLLLWLIGQSTIYGPKNYTAEDSIPL
jgi:hypothetical protein